MLDIIKDVIYKVQPSERLEYPNVRSIQFSPTGSLLALFQFTTADRASHFTLLNPTKERGRKAILERSFYVRETNIVWQADGRRVSIVTDPKENTQILSYAIERDFAQSRFKFPPGSQVVDFAYSPDSTHCVCLVRPRQKKQDQEV